jgi:eukaryotic-like serine/threonine-protein kinase
MATAADRPSRPEGTEKGGRYHLSTQIGSGGMGTVHIGRLQSSADFARTVAIKRPLPELARDPSFRDSVRREARVAARVHHPNVVATLDVVEVANELWVVMEYVHGPALSTLFSLARERRQLVPLDVALALVEGTLRGLDAVHSARDETGAPLGIVHRDLSPQNILCGSDGMARVADFGLARAEAMTSITHTARFKGKLAYASPEQAESLPVTPASDLFSTGIVLWELLTGQRLYSGATGTEIVARLLTAEIAPPSSLRADVPDALDAVVLHALERDPKRRFSSASGMLDALQRAHPAASVDGVALWLREFASDWMAERDRLLSAAERGNRASAEPALVTSSERDPSGVFPSLQRAISVRRLLRGAGVAMGVSLAWFGADVMLAPRRPDPDLRSVSAAPLEPWTRAAGANGSEPSPSAGAAAAPPLPPTVAGESSRLHPPHRSDADASVDSSGGDGFSTERRTALPRSLSQPAALGAASDGRDGPRAASSTSAARDLSEAKLPAAEALECDPPYSVDADGIRHMRPGCQ